MANDESRIITLDDAREKRNPKNRMHDYCTREEMVTSATTAALGVGEKVYNEIAAEHAEQFEKLEHVLWQKLYAELERRSLRGKLRALWARIRPARVDPPWMMFGQEADDARYAAMTPTEGPWADALNPTVHQAAHDEFVSRNAPPAAP